MPRIESLRLAMGVIAVGNEVAYCIDEGVLSKGRVHEILPVKDYVFKVSIEGVGLIDSKHIFCTVYDLITLHLGGTLRF